MNPQNISSIDKKFMNIAIDQAKIAYYEDEIPVGAVIVRDEIVIAKAHNQNRALNDPTMHAEMIAIQETSRIFKNERLINCVLYITKEPCSMCAGAIINARIKKVIIAAEDARYGACGTVLSVCGNKKLNHIPEIEFGVFRDQASDLLKDFFKNLRPGKEI